MKVLYVISYPYEATGSQRSLFTTIKHLPKDIEPHVLLSDEGYVRELFDSIDIPTSVIRPTGPLQVYGKAAFSWSFFQKVSVFLFHYLPFQWRLFRFIRNNKFDIVHCNSHRSTVLIVLATKLARVKLITHLRNEVRFRNLYTHLYEKYSDSIVTVSKAIRKDIASPYKHKIATVYNGLERPDMSLYNKQKSKKLRLICLSLIVPHKGLHHIIDVANCLKKAGRAEELEFICLGPVLEHHKEYKEWLDEKIATLELSNIQFLGYKKDPFPYLATSDVVVLPSISKETLSYNDKTEEIIGNEGLPRVLLEACGFGKPAIAFDVPGVNEIIEEGKNGFIVEAANILAFAQRIEKFLDNSALKEEMGENALKIYKEKFSVAQNVTGIVEIYKTLQ